MQQTPLKTPHKKIGDRQISDDDNSSVDSIWAEAGRWQNVLRHPWDAYGQDEPAWETPQNMKDKALLEELESRVQITVPNEEWELRDTDQEIVDNGSTDDSNYKDYAKMSDVGSSKRGGN